MSHGREGLSRRERSQTAFCVHGIKNKYKKNLFADATWNRIIGHGYGKYLEFFR